jgi:hypothetical protein
MATAGERNRLCRSPINGQRAGYTELGSDAILELDDDAGIDGEHHAWEFLCTLAGALSRKRLKPIFRSKLGRDLLSALQVGPRRLNLS